MLFINLENPLLHSSSQWKLSCLQLQPPGRAKWQLVSNSLVCNNDSIVVNTCFVTATVLYSRSWLPEMALSLQHYTWLDNLNLFGWLSFVCCLTSKTVFCCDITNVVLSKCLVSQKCKVCFLNVQLILVLKDIIMIISLIKFLIITNLNMLYSPIVLKT